MPYDPQQDIPVGTPVVDSDGKPLGLDREAYPNYLLVGQDDRHGDTEIQTNSILRLRDGTLTVSVMDDLTTKVDNVETAHRLMDNEQ